MNNIVYTKNTKRFKTEQLPKLIYKYHLKNIPFGNIGTKYLGDSVSITVDKKDVRIYTTRADIAKEMANFLN